MKIAVVGLWHLGTVTAACLAAEGHRIVAIDDVEVVDRIVQGILPVDEPGLGDLIAQERQSGRLSFAADVASTAEADVLWFCYDTPVDDDDRPDAGFVIDRVARFLTEYSSAATVVISSQLPVGSVAEIERRVGTQRFAFAAIPENLRLGSAIAYFRAPDRFVAGVRDDRTKKVIEAAVGSFSPAIVWMSVESAEMTKHAINAFLATSVSFANELAAVCERVGADAREVERGLKSDVRVGPKAYVRAGEAFAGGTLARDLNFLAAMGDREGLALQQLRATAASNAGHRLWAAERIADETRGISSPRVALLGLVYKPGTDTLRASTAVALARHVAGRGASVRAFDPAIRPADARLVEFAEVASSAEAVLEGADVAVVGTAWPQFRDIPPSAFTRMRRPVVIDPPRFLEDRLAGVPGVRYVGFGRAANTVVQ